MLERSDDEAPHRGYRPHLDGLRTVAVYLVVLFHAGIGRANGGYIGVDVFFVLSGYLVARLLLRDVVDGGRLGFARFYARRMRRLLPASFLVLVVTAITYSAVASPVQVDAAEGGIRASFLYVANWYFIAQSADYFAPAIESSPVIHFWSLAVEEQFYLVAPLALAGLFRATRRLSAPTGHRVRQGVVLGCLLASLLAAELLRRTDLNRAYLGTDTRVYQLLAGVLLAMSPGLLARFARTRLAPVAAGVTLVGIVVAGSWIVELDPVRRGMLAALLSVALIAAMESADGPVNRLLSIEPAVYLGRISYGTYLWHWPVILLMGELIEAGPLATAAVAILVASGLASLSYHLLEQPVRTWPRLGRINRAVVAGGVAASLVGGLVVVPAIFDRADPVVTEAAVDTAGFTPVPPVDPDFVRSNAGDLHGVDLVQSCVGEPASTCTVVTGPGDHVLVVGDSHAQALFPAFAKLAQDEGLTLSTAASGACAWQQHVYLPSDVPGSQQRNAECEAFREDLFGRVIPELQPDVIVAVARDYLSDRAPGVVRDDSGQTLPAATGAELAAQVQDDTEASLDVLRSLADRVVLVEPIPTATPDQDPLVCLSESDVVERCRFVAEGGTGPLPIEEIYRDVADGEHVWSTDLDRLVCPFAPICDPIVDGQVVYFDHQHLAPAYAVDIAAEIATQLKAAGALPSG